MKRNVIFTVLLLLSQNCLFSADIDNGKYGRAFMDIGVGARFLGMGSAAVSFVDDVTSLYWNPAGLSHIEGFEIHAMHDERFQGAVNWDFLGAAVKRHGLSMAVGLFRSGVDQIPLTRLLDPNRSLGEVFVNDEGRTVVNDPYAYKWIDQQELALVASVGKQYRKRFYIGTSARIIRKIMGDDSAWGLGFDVGAQWQAAKSLWLGLTVMDVTSTWVAWNTGRTEYIKPRAVLGASTVIQTSFARFRPALDIQLNGDDYGDASQFTAGPVGGDIGGGVEVMLNVPAVVRFGLFRGQLTAGAGFRIGSFAIDYGFAASSDLGDSHRISLGVLSR